MKVMILDKDSNASTAFIAEFKEHIPNSESFLFTNGEVALKQVRLDPPDVVFIALEEGNEAAYFRIIDTIRTIDDKINIIVIASDENKAFEAFRHRVSGYILRPCDWPDVMEELNNLRNPIKGDLKHRVYIKTFGIFDAFLDGKPVNFNYIKTRELLAYLFYRQGSMCTNQEIIATLWDTEGHDDYLRQIRKDLVDMARENGLDDLIYHRRGIMALNMNRVGSDYADWLNGVSYATKLYQGEFMAQYSWAESMNGQLQQKQF